MIQVGFIFSTFSFVYIFIGRDSQFTFLNLVSLMLGLI